MVGDRHVGGSASCRETEGIGRDGRSQVVVVASRDAGQVGANPIRHVIGLLRRNRAVVGGLVIVQADGLQASQTEQSDGKHNDGDQNFEQREAALSAGLRGWHRCSGEEEDWLLDQGHAVVPVAEVTRPSIETVMLLPLAVPRVSQSLNVSLKPELNPVF